LGVLVAQGARVKVIQVTNGARFRCSILAFMRSHRILFSIFLLACSASAADFNLKPRYPFHFVIYGDIRFTDPSNTRSSDPVRRELLVKEIAEDKPAFVVILGDLVLKGSNPGDWKQFDEGVKPLRDSGIEMFPVIGNHDLSGDPTASAYLAHFPELKGKRWYSVQAGECMLFVLDSALDQEGGDEWKWLDAGLHELGKETRFVIVALHHPPVTHSVDNLSGGGHSARVQEQPLAALVEAARARTGLPMFVVGGHVHNYERYEQSGVVYITSGGGGATPYEIPRKPGDAYHETGPTYHYTEWTIGKDTLTYEMNKLEVRDDKPVWTVKDKFEVKNKKGPKRGS
jgi:Icc-related predicted phosphoesterase